MNLRAWRLPAVLLLAGTVAVLSLASAGSGSVPSFAQEPTPDSPIPCDPQVDRTVNKQILQEGDEVDVRVEYNFKCSREKRRVNFIFLVENSQFLRGGEPTPKPVPDGTSPQVGEQLNSVRNALKQFANEVDFDNGSCGGLTLYTTDYQPIARFPQCGENGRDFLLRQMGIITTKPAGNVSGLVSAIRDQTQVLPERTEDALNVLIIVDAGAPILAEGLRLSDIETSCKVAANAGVLRVILSLYGTGRRLAGIKDCASPGWVFQSQDENGKDLLGPGGLMDQIAQSLIRAQRVTTSEFSDRMNSYLFEYVPGSGRVDGRPSEPAMIAGSELVWTFNSEPAEANRIIEYKVKSGDDWGEGKGNLSYVSELILDYGAGLNLGRVPVPNPAMCVYTTSKPDFCDTFALTLTPPTTATATPVATDTSTASPPTDTPVATVTSAATDTPVATVTPVPTDTPEGPKGVVYLPLLLRGVDLRVSR